MWMLWVLSTQMWGSKIGQQMATALFSDHYQYFVFSIFLSHTKYMNHSHLKSKFECDAVDNEVFHSNVPVSNSCVCMWLKCLIVIESNFLKYWHILYYLPMTLSSWTHINSLLQVLNIQAHVCVCACMHVLCARTSLSWGVRVQ